MIILSLLRSRRILSVLLILPFFCLMAEAQNGQLKPAVEVMMFKKVFKYVTTLRKSPSILILHDSRTSKPDEILDAFKSEKFFAATTPSNDVESVISNFDVIYLMPGIKVAPLKDFFIKKKVLVITGDPGLVSSGLAALAIASEKKHPVICLNPLFLASCGHEVSVELINLAKVYR